MEPHKSKLSVAETPELEEGVHVYFEKAWNFATSNYQEEMDFIMSTSFDRLTPDEFFREYIWVVHATGFSAKAVGKFFPKLTIAYGDWRELAQSNFESKFENVRLVCNNKLKAKAVHSTAKIIESSIQQFGWENYKKQELNEASKLVKFPYIGKVTCYHLARNIGLLDSVKPDLHLIRMAKYWGFDDCEAMCKAVQPKGIPLGIVDLVLWYAASTFGTLNIRAEGDR